MQTEKSCLPITEYIFFEQKLSTSINTFSRKILHFISQLKSPTVRNFELGIRPKTLFLNSKLISQLYNNNL